MARYLDPGARLELVEGALDADVVVVTGSLLTGVRTEPGAGRPVDDGHDHHDDQPVEHHGTTDHAPSSTTSDHRRSATCPTAPEGVDC